MNPIFLLLLVLQSCVMFSGERTTTTKITSTPSGAEVYAIHNKSIHNIIYKNYNQVKDGDKVMSFQGVTPLDITVAKGMNTKFIIKKEGYKDTEFYARITRAFYHIDGKDNACLGDKYYSWAVGGLWDSIVNRDLHKNIYNDYCSNARHAYHIHLEPIENNT